MKYFGYLSFGHHANGHQSGPDAGESLTQAVELARRADAIGVNGAYLRVHHFAPQHSSPMSLLGAVAGATENLEVGTGVIDIRYENPLHLAEEAATLDLVSRGRVALGVSRGSPEPARRGWEAFGYTAEAPDGRDMARQKFLRLLAAADGEAMAVSDTLENNTRRCTTRAWGCRSSRSRRRCAATSGGVPARTPPPSRPPTTG